MWRAWQILREEAQVARRDVLIGLMVKDQDIIPSGARVRLTGIAPPYFVCNGYPVGTEGVVFTSSAGVCLVTVKGKQPFVAYPCMLEVI